MDIRVTALLAAVAAFYWYLLRRAGIIKGFKYVIICTALLIAAFALRLACFNYETNDYRDFLTKWVSFFRDNGGFAALSRPVGNYNIPYLYFMALFSYSGIRDLYLIKLLSVFFDGLLAYSAMQLLGLCTQSRAKKAACFFTVLFLPTVFLNGSVWGQCDSIYVALGLLAVYLALSDRPIRAMVCIALSFGFKLQAVFIMPVFAVLLIQKKVKLWHFLFFPLTYIALVLPAVLIGRPFMETITLYFDQSYSVGTALTYQAPSVFAFFRDPKHPELYAKLGIAAAFIFMFAVILICFIYRKRLTKRATLAALMLMVVGIPFLLPHMHDRYFFAADVVTLICAFVSSRYLAAAVLTQFASFLGYYAYLKWRFLLYMDRGAAALIIVLAFGIVFFTRSLVEKKFTENEISC